MISVNNLTKKVIDEIEDLELKIFGLKAMMFENFQPFNAVYDNFKLNEVIVISNIGYAVVTYKDEKTIKFKTVVKNGKEWLPHWQDADKILKIKKGIYYDILTQKEHKEDSELFIPAYKTSHFKSVGKDDLVIYGQIFKKTVN